MWADALEVALEVALELEPELALVVGFWSALPTLDGKDLFFTGFLGSIKVPLTQTQALTQVKLLSLPGIDFNSMRLPALTPQIPQPTPLRGSRATMYLIAIAWIYVVLMMSVAEATAANGTVLGALVTFVLYGLLPLGIVLYIFGTPGRKRARRAAEAASEAAPQTVLSAASQTAVETVSVSPPNHGDHASGDAVAPVRKES